MDHVSSKVSTTDGSAVFSKTDVNLMLVSACVLHVLVQIMENLFGTSDSKATFAHVSNPRVCMSSRHSRGAIPEPLLKDSASSRRPETKARTTDSALAESICP